MLECFVGFKRVGKSCVKDKEIDQSAEKLVRHHIFDPMQVSKMISKLEVHWTTRIRTSCASNDEIRAAR